MPSLLHAFIFLFYVEQNLFCGEARGDVAERGGLHAEVLLRRGGRGGEGGGGGGGVGGGGRGGGGRGGRRQGGASPALGGRRAEQRVEIQSPFQRGSARHGLEKARARARAGRGGESPSARARGGAMWPEEAGKGSSCGRGARRQRQAGSASSASASTRLAPPGEAKARPLPSVRPSVRPIDPPLLPVQVALTPGRATRLEAAGTRRLPRRPK